MPGRAAEEQTERGDVQSEDQQYLEEEDITHGNILEVSEENQDAGKDVVHMIHPIGVNTDDFKECVTSKLCVRGGLDA